MTAPDRTDRDHLRTIVILWAIASIIGIALVVFVLGPHMPPGRATSEAADQTSANIIMSAIVTPIMLAVWVYFAYAIRTFRRRRGDTAEGPADRGSSHVQIAWVGVTGTIVLFLAVWGSFTLLSTAEGAGGGQGPNPLVVPSGPKVQVQVIGQQWQFTFRYPGYGGFESAQLMIPADSTIEFHVTSIDVTHAFWAYQLGVKADAVPGTQNIAFVHTHGPSKFDIRCAELCGLWHGYMYTTGHVLSKSAFAAWAKSQAQADAPIKPAMEPYAPVYVPDPTARGG